jgi:hypothetical protein
VTKAGIKTLISWFIPPGDPRKPKTDNCEVFLGGTMDELNWLFKLREFKGEDKVGSNHHLLPKFYMANFANQKGKVGSKDRSNGSERLNVSPNKLLIQRDFYTFLNLEMQSDGSVEELISKIEAMACEVIRRRLTVFQKFPMDSDDSWALSYFAALQLLRGRRMRRTIEILGDFYAKTRFVGLNESNAKDFLIASEIEASDEEVSKLLKFKSELPDIFITPTTNDHIQFLLMSISPWASLFRQRPISLLKFNEPTLVTSDEPFLFFHEDTYRRNGLAFADEILFPISPQHLLIFGAMGTFESQFFHCPSGIFDSKEFNKAMFENSHEMIIFNPDYNYRGIARLPKQTPLIHIQASNNLIPNNFTENSNLRSPLSRFHLARDPGNN